MRRAIRWSVAVVLSCALAAVAQDAGTDERLVEARRALDEATKLKDEGRYADAIPHAERAAALREAALGATHPEVAACLELAGKLHQWNGDLSRAEPLLQRALAIREKALGGNHPDVADSLSTLAMLYWEQGANEKAEPLLQRGLTIREMAFGKDHPKVADSLTNLGIIHWARGLFGQAASFHQRALAIREAALGENHLSVAAALDNLAIAYAEQGLYGHAAPVLQRALSIREAAIGDKHPNTASSYQNLANLYWSLGLYGRAEPLYLRALDIWQPSLGDNHPLVASVLNNLGTVYLSQGLYSRADPLLQRALAIREKGLGKDHPEIATPLDNIALLYYRQGLHARAEPLYRRALAIREKGLGDSHPLVATSLNNLANLYADQGLYSRAEPLYQRALAIRERALGRDHSLVAVSLNNLADLYADQGLYSRAEPLYQRARATWEAALGEGHADVVPALTGLARLYLAKRRLPEALPLFTRAFTLSEERLRIEALDFSEGRLASFLQFLRGDEESLYALLRAHPEDARVLRLALTAALLLKGRSLEETANTSRAVYRSLGAEDREAFERLRGLRTQLARLSLEGPDGLAPADYQQRLKDLAEQGDALEANLARRSAPLRALTALPSPAEIVDRVAASLPGDSALVELIAYSDRPLVPKAGVPRVKTPSQLRYLAVVLFPDASIRAVDLGRAGPIDTAASRLRDALSQRDAAYQRTAQTLYQAAFRPLLPLLGNTRRIFLSPDGQLGLVPFSVFHDGKRFLADTFDFTYLTSGKDLLPRPDDISPERSVVVFADPDFGASPTASAGSLGGATALAERSFSVERFFSTLDRGITEQPWVPLPGTRKEANALHRLLPQAQLFLGQDASKERLLQLDTPGILHIATHGFFLEDAAAPPDSRGVAVTGPLGSEVPALHLPDPLLRSGLVLAGARAPAPDAEAKGTRRVEGSLVSALELAGVNLWGTQLVVLSACDTGRGDIKLGQGVYGLRRALVVAGAETLVMSLWKVNDETTRELMESYYRNLLEGKGRAAALREAMLALRVKQPHAHLWAPFIVIGRDGPLRGLMSAAP